MQDSSPSMLFAQGPLALAGTPVVPPSSTQRFGGHMRWPPRAPSPPSTRVHAHTHLQWRGSGRTDGAHAPGTRAGGHPTSARHCWVMPATVCFWPRRVAPAKQPFCKAILHPALQSAGMVVLYVWTFGPMCSALKPYPSLVARFAKKAALECIAGSGRCWPQAIGPLLHCRRWRFRKRFDN